VRGFSDPSAIRLSSGRPVFYQPDTRNRDGYLLPFHLDAAPAGVRPIPSTSHTWPVQHASWNAGKMDNWLAAHHAADGSDGSFTMGYYARDDIPFHFALAENFTVCDNYFCSVLGPTWPNRLYLMSGTLDPLGDAGGPVLSNSDPVPYRWKTYPEALTEAGVSWRVYQEADNYQCNVLEYFKSFQDAPVRSPLFRNGLRTYPAGQFEFDAANDRLPAVSWIIPTSYQSEHPDYPLAAGADYVASKIDAIASNPDVWAKTVFILNYDENDGLFDHVPPPTPPPGTPFELVKGEPVGAGFRVPCIIVSPWTQGGWIATDPFDHTSTLRFIERLTGVRVPNLSGWRRATFGDLTSAFGLPTGNAFPRLPDPRPRVRPAVHDTGDLSPPPLPGAVRGGAVRAGAGRSSAAAQTVPRQVRGPRPRPRGGPQARYRLSPRPTLRDGRA
jgi:phospholipase C